MKSSRRVTRINELLKVICTALPATLLMAGCNLDSPADTPANSARIVSTTSTARQKANTAPDSHRTRSTDAQLTESLITVTGNIKFDDGSPVTSGKIELTPIQSGNGRQTAMPSITELISSDGSYKVTFSHAPFSTIKLSGKFPTTEQTIGYGEPGATPAHDRRTNDFTVPRGHNLTGRVVDDRNQPVAGASVIAIKHFADPDSNTDPTHQDETSSTETGEFTFPHIAPGTNIIVATHPDLASGNVRTEIPTTGSVTVKLLPGATVTGHVYRQDTGEPYAGATVTAHEKDANQPYPKKATSQADGSFRIEHIAPGTVSIAVASNDPNLGTYFDYTSVAGKSIALADGDTTDVTLLVYPGHTLTGKVFDHETMEPLAGAEVVTHDGSSSATADANGIYTLHDLFPGASKDTLSLRANYKGFTTVIKDRSPHSGYVQMHLHANDVAPKYDIAMAKTVSVRGTVRTAEGVPVPMASVHARSPGNYYPSDIVKEQTNADGYYELEVRPFYDGIAITEAAGFTTGYSEAFHVDNRSIDNVDITLHVGATAAGTVVGPDGKPAEGATVRANFRRTIKDATFTDLNGSVETDATGRFLLSNLPQEVQISATHDSLSDAESKELFLKAGESRANILLQLRTPNVIAGRVVDSKNLPVENADIIARGNSFSSNKTAADGSFTLTRLTEGIYTLHVSGTSTYKQNVKSGTTGLTIQVEDKKASPGATGTLIGTVVDATTKEPIDDFHIDSMGTRITKDANFPGRFVAEGLRQEITYVAKLKAPDRIPEEILVRVPAGKSLIEQTFTIGRGGAITGTVIDAETLEPIPGITVINWGDPSSAYRSNNVPKGTCATDDEGNFTIAPAPIGANLLIFRAPPPYAELTSRIEVKNEQTANVGKIEIRRGGAIYGTVTGPGKQPLANAVISIQGDDNTNYIDTVRRSTTTDAEGNYRFEGLSDRYYTLAAAKYTVTKSIKLPYGEEEKVDFNLGGITVTGHVTQGGIPFPCTISATSKDDATIRVSTTARSGNYEIAGLTPGQWDFKISQYQNFDKRSYTETVAVPDIEEFEKNFILPDVSVSGVVVYADSKPAANAQVRLLIGKASRRTSGSWGGDFFFHTDTDFNGRFAFMNLAEGPCHVYVYDRATGKVTKTVIEAQDGKPVELKLELK